MIYHKNCGKVVEPLTSVEGNVIELVCPDCRTKMGSITCDLPVVVETVEKIVEKVVEVVREPEKKPRQPRVKKQADE